MGSRKEKDGHRKNGNYTSNSMKITFQFIIFLKRVKHSNVLTALSKFSDHDIIYVIFLLTQPGDLSLNPVL